MSRRSAALFAGPAGAFALAVAFNAAAAPAECLVAPGAAAPEGQHWFYRTDPATKQKCWYLRARDIETTGATASPQGPHPVGTGAEQAGAPARLSKGEQDALFQDFLRWRKQRGEQP